MLLNVAWECSCGEVLDDAFDQCWSCQRSRDAGSDVDDETLAIAERRWEAVEPRQYPPPVAALSNAPPPDAASVVGLVRGVAVAGSGVFSDMAGEMRDFVGGRARAWENRVSEAVQAAHHDMLQQAREHGANSLYAVRTEFGTAGAKGSAFVVIATGTAVLMRD